MSLLVTTSTAVIKLYKARVTVKQLRTQLRQRVLVLGVVGEIPADLVQMTAPLLDITQIEDVALYPSKTGYLLHCKRLSYALKHCNFVIGDVDDVKVIRNKDQLKAVLEGFTNGS